MPLPIATIAATLFQPIVSAVNDHAQRRARGSSPTLAAALTVQPHPSAQGCTITPTRSFTTRRYACPVVSATKMLPFPLGRRDANLTASRQTMAPPDVL